MDINKLNRHFIAVDNLDNIDTVIDVLTEPWIIKYEDTYYSTESNNNMKFTLSSDYSPEYIKDYFNRNRSTILALCTSEDNKYYTFVYKNLLTDLNDYNDIEEGNGFIEYVKDIIIPNSVTSISLGMFSGRTNLKSITLSNSLTSIHSFDGCENLTYIDIPNSITTIEQNAFIGCTNLETIKIGNSLSEINNDAFNSCSNLKSIVIPSSVNYIKDNVFYNCTNMSSVTLNNGVKTIGENAFGNCYNLTSIKLPESLTSIAANAFTKCEHLTIISTEYGDFKTDLYGDVSIMYNNGNSMVFNVRDAINNEIWYTTTDNKEIEGLPYSDTLKFQHEYTRGKGVITFEGQQLINIVTKLFDGKGTLSTIQIPLTIEEIGESAFAGCISLKSIKLTNNDIENPRILTINNHAFANCKSLTHIVLPNSINSIGGYAFENCVMLNNIILPDNLTTITQYSFKACKSLTSITIPSNVTTIGNNAFQECFNIKHIDFTPTITSTGESKITSIGEYAFSQCNLLTSVNLHDINTIGDSAFSNCLSLRSVKFNTINTNHNINNNIFEGCKNLDYIIVDNEIFYREYDKITVYDSNKQPFTFVITTQGNDEIWYTSADENVIALPSTGEFNVKIKSNIYKYGTGVITFDGDLTNIGNSAFNGCGDLTSITIPNGVISIGRMAFYGCSTLSSITISNSVTTIGPSAFGNCQNLTSIIYEGTMKEWEENITIEDDSFSNGNTITVKCSDGDITIEN